MTYCLAIKVNDGLVLASDSRTNAGVDYIRTYSKMHTFCWQHDRVVVILTAGNLATTQAVINQVKFDLEKQDSEFNLRKATHLFEIARYIGRLSQEEQRQHSEAMESSGGDAAANFIIGGQITSQEHEIFHVYPEGNYISASMETPYLQLGETKYGKPILDRIVSAGTLLEDAARCALVSLDSTMRSNVSVGPPLELCVYRKDSLDDPVHLDLDTASPFYKAVQKQWNEGLRKAFQRLPRFDWE